MLRPRLKMRLGDLLEHEGIISASQLQQALLQQQSSGRKLGATLIELKFLTEVQLLQFLAQQLNVPFLDIAQKQIDPKAVQLLPEVQARRFRALVLEDHGSKVILGMSDPADLTALDQLAVILAPRQIELVVVRESQLIEAFDSLYRRTKDIESFATQLKAEHGEDSRTDFSALDELNDADNTIVKLLQSIFEDAVQVKASDIHIEPDEKVLRIRQRVDGVLQENTLDQVSIASALVLRLKLMANLDISEKRLPQDGRFQINVKQHQIDVRISTMPVQHGESVVMRLLDQSAGLLHLEETGMPAPMLAKLRRIIQSPHGMILVTGPTGSGKTTTLYGVLSELNQPGSKIITVEDPVEYRLPRINQVQVNHKIGLTFGNVLRTTLRQDPDIIMVGEMRDQETAEMGLRGALTGHLVLSTLHTNDAVTSTLRLIDMGAAPYLVASALRAIVAQRLVRRLCDYCKQPYQPDELETNWLRHHRANSAATYWHAPGCQSCNHTGYKGRLGVFELLLITKPLADALRREDTVGFANLAHTSEGFTSLGSMALQYAQQGITSLDEVIRVSEYLDNEPDDMEQG
ncbi:MAG: GspE/PulE family protein [Gammaproteobacteria bacterium]|nr:GspE/PulE family protein [Gammaproteobacteria bacterium]MBU1553303.1 GspE/PulE family protein [Gammaproteobacteria bacterium]MBU2070847.1 GspE/PulE family protein [Gammaproteobacteria bacterium]MBU2182838.1 GspE/PulE family protein [Gammaproteobacteria bacterium]MBU2203607.1 GspE/PulE family protein [Gammaproteobacteria bacterium]